MHIKQNNSAENRQQAQGQNLVMGGGEFAARLLRVEKAFEYDTDSEILRTWEWIGAMSRGKRKH